MKRTNVTEELCRKVQLMMAGNPDQKEVARLLGTSATTVSRIKAAGFDYATFLKNTDRRRVEQQNARADAAIERINKEIEKVRAAEAQPVPGQIRMEIPEKPAETEKPESVTLPMSDQVKMMRFIAGQVDRIVKALEEVKKALNDGD